MRNEFTALIQRGEDGWWIAISPEVPSAVGQGKTPDETRDDLGACIEFVLDYQRERAFEEADPETIRDVVTVG